MDGTTHAVVTSSMRADSNRLGIMHGLSIADMGAELDTLTRADEHIRRSVGRAILSDFYRNLLNFVVLGNLVLVVIQADRGAHLRSMERSGGNIELTSMDVGINLLNQAFLFIYIIDIILHMFFYRWSYFKDGMRNFDLIVVSVDVFSNILEFVVTDLPSASVLRVFRLAKVLRAAKLVSGIKELHMIIMGFAGAMRALVFGMIVVSVLLLFWSVVCVELIQVYTKELQEMGAYSDCSRCPRAFDSVGDAMLTLVQTTFVADSWGEITVPIIEYQGWTAIPLIFMYSSVNLGVLNLILTAVVESANDRRESDKEHKVLSKIKDAEAAKDKLKTICQQMDHDGSDTLTYDEIVKGYEQNRDFFNTMELLDVGKDDMAVIFKILDSDKSGSVTSDEFVNALHKMATEESHSILVFVKHSIQEVQETLHEQISVMRDLFAGAATGNGGDFRSPKQSDVPDRDLAEHLPDMGIDGHCPRSPELEGRFDPRHLDVRRSPEASAADRPCAPTRYARIDSPCSGNGYSTHPNGRFPAPGSGLDYSPPPLSGREYSPPLSRREHSPPLGGRRDCPPLIGRDYAPPLRGPGSSGWKRPGMVQMQENVLRQQQALPPYHTRISQSCSEPNWGYERHATNI